MLKKFEAAGNVDEVNPNTISFRQPVQYPVLHTWSLQLVIVSAHYPSQSITTVN